MEARREAEARRGRKEGQEREGGRAETRRQLSQCVSSVSSIAYVHIFLPQEKVPVSQKQVPPSANPSTMKSCLRKNDRELVNAVRKLRRISSYEEALSRTGELSSLSRSPSSLGWVVLDSRLHFLPKSQRE